MCVFLLFLERRLSFTKGADPGISSERRFFICWSHDCQSEGPSTTEQVWVKETKKIWAYITQPFAGKPEERQKQRKTHICSSSVTKRSQKEQILISRESPKFSVPLSFTSLGIANSKYMMKKSIPKFPTFIFNVPGKIYWALSFDAVWYCTSWYNLTSEVVSTQRNISDVVVSIGIMCLFLLNLTILTIRVVWKNTVISLTSEQLS